MTAAATGLLRSRRFDLAFVLGPLALGLLVGGAGVVAPAAFPAVLAFDLWFLSYPHNAATFTRIAFSREDARSHRFLLAALPLLALGASGAIARAGGLDALTTVYFYWQSYHYARQSYGIDRAYRRAGPPDAPAGDALAAAVAYLFPLLGVLRRCAQGSATFFGSRLYVPPVPRAAVVVAGALAVGALCAWLVRALRRGERAALPRAAYLVSHALVFGLGYVVVRDLTRGWLIVNVWHNAQYSAFVWAQNQRRFRDGRDPARPLLSWLCARRNVVAYVTACVGLATAFYAAMVLLAQRVGASDAAALVVVLGQGVNFHHYVVDAVIWRAKRPTAVAKAA